MAKDNNKKKKNDLPLKDVGTSSTKKKYTLLPEIRITGFSTEAKREIDNIADNIGVTTSSFLKQKLREIIDSYPAHMKQPIKKD